jgi:hypothetical protein
LCNHSPFGFAMKDRGVQMLRVADGADLADALGSVGPGWVVATGVVVDVELRVAGSGADPVRIAHGRRSLVSLSGPGGGPYQVILARAAEGEIEMMAGTLRRGKAESVSAVWFPVQEIAPEVPARAEPVPSATWAARAAAAAEAARDRSEEPEYRPGSGDLVHHFAFGLCDVLKVSGNTLTIRDVKGPARIREIRIDLLKVQAPEERDGKRVYRLIRRP